MRIRRTNLNGIHAGLVAAALLALSLAAQPALALAFEKALPDSRIFYAVKANPAPEVVAALVAEGSGFDVASTGEIDLCLEQGADPADLSYGNPIKKAADIAYAHARGVRRFTFDSDGDLENLAAHAPGSRVACRFLVDAPASGTPFGAKFGCAPAMAVRLLARAAELGLAVDGACFHVGSQHRDPAAWVAGIAQAAGIARELAARGVPTPVSTWAAGSPPATPSPPRRWPSTPRRSARPSPSTSPRRRSWSSSPAGRSWPRRG